MMGSRVLVIRHAFICCMVLMLRTVCGLVNVPWQQAAVNLTGLQHPPHDPLQPSAGAEPRLPFSVLTLASHKLSNGVVVDCVRLLPNATSTPTSTLQEALFQFPRAGSGWRRLTPTAKAQFDVEVPHGCSVHEGSMVVQRGDIFDDIITHRHVLTPGNNPKRSYSIHSSVEEGFFTGATAALSINNPLVQNGEVSISQMWVVANRGDDDNYSTLEAGWIVHPEAFGDNDPRLFIYWTNDNYLSTGCFNRICPGFVQTDFTWQLGERFPTGASIPGNANRQQYVLFVIFKDPNSGKWYLQLDAITVGYWDPNIVTNFGDSFADELQFGGEVQTRALGTSTQMGSGYFPRRGFPWAASVSFLRFLHNSLDFNYFGPDDLDGYDTHPNFYGLSGLKLDSQRRVDKFFFGGPGN